MIDARILLQCNSWLRERTDNLDQVKGLPEEKKAQYRILFQCSQYLVNWLNEQLTLGVYPGNAGNAAAYFSPSNFQQSCNWLSNYYTSIANIAEADLKQPENKQKRADEQTMIVSLAFLKLIAYFRKAH